jgi:hypothetical protein
MNAATLFFKTILIICAVVLSLLGLGGIYSSFSGHILLFPVFAAVFALGVSGLLVATTVE